MLRLENLWKLRTAVINQYANAAAAYYLPQKSAPFFAFFYKTRANAQPELPNWAKSRKLGYF